MGYKRGRHLTGMGQLFGTPFGVGGEQFIAVFLTRIEFTLAARSTEYVLFKKRTAGMAIANRSTSFVIEGGG